MKIVGLRVVILLGLSLASVSSVQAQFLRIRDICRVKGQEENTLHGMGLVVGLKGTGDTDGPTMRALAKMMELMGNPVGHTVNGQLAMEDLKNARNVALVFVTATVPPEGARQGEQLNCVVNAISAQSLEGGHLVMTPLVGPRPGQSQVYAIAQGAIALNEFGPPTSGVVHDGCRLEENFTYTFTDQGYVTLVIDRNHASFPTADEIEKAINGKVRQGGDSPAGPYGSWGDIAEATSPLNVRVRIPESHANRHVEFIATVLDVQVAIQNHDARVVVNERNGVIVVGENVTVGRVAVTHKNISIQTGEALAGDGPLHVIDQAGKSSTTRLDALVETLNALKARPEDVIDIIKSLERSGDLYGRLVIE